MSKTKSLPDQLQALDNSLNDFWMVKFFPHPDATRRGVKRRAMAAGRKAYAIMQAAEAAGDKATARKAEALAKGLIPYANGSCLRMLPA